MLVSNMGIRTCDDMGACTCDDMGHIHCTCDDMGGCTCDYMGVHVCTCDDMGRRTCKAVHLKFKGVETQSVDCTLLKNKLLLVTFILDAPDKEIQVQIPYRNPMWSSLG